MKNHELENDIPRYRKKSSKHGEKKSDHKHTYVSCVFERDLPRFDDAHGLVYDGESTSFSIGTYCPICGKIGTTCDRGWTELRKTGRWYETGWNEAAQREFNPSSRTLPYFHISDFFQKYVSVKEDGK